MTFYLRLDFICLLMVTWRNIFKLAEVKILMKLSKYLFSALLLIFSISCASQKEQSPSADRLLATALKPYGRYSINNAENLELISSAAHFGFSFEGKECRLYASVPSEKEHNYLQYELDGVYQKRIRIEGNSKEPIVLHAFTEGKHTIWIYKATEAHTGPITIQSIVAKNLTSIQKNKSLPLIEFIGNSITCGAAADTSEVPCGAGKYHDQHNAYLAYGPRVARALNADFILSSVSGIGIYRNWNSDGPTMPQVYEKVDFQNTTSKLWNFTESIPQIVSIALGTNDFSTGDGENPRLPFDTIKFQDNYVMFIQLVKSKYPKAKIALLSSPMVQGSSRLIFQNCLAEIKKRVDILYPSDKPVSLFFFEPMQARGCSGHPNVEDHAILAKQLLPFFSDLL